MIERLTTVGLRKDSKTFNAFSSKLNQSGRRAFGLWSLMTSAWSMCLDLTKR